MKKLLWVEEDLVENLQLLDEVEEISQEKIKEYIKKFNEDVDCLSENVDASILELRAKAQRVRDSYEKVVNEEIEKSYELWEVLDTKRCESREKAKELRVDIEGISSEITSLKNNIKTINFYAIDSLIEAIDKISRLDNNGLELLNKLFLNFKI